MLSIITINYNGLDLTCKMLDSLRRYLSIPFETIVVDNGSENGEASAIEERYGEVTVIRSAENLGYAGGNNLGAKAAKGDYLFFLNNDTEILDGDIETLLSHFGSDPRIGIICPKIRFFEGTRPIQFAGYTEMRGINMKNDLVGYLEEDRGQYGTMTRTPFAHGAAMIVRREAYEDVGPIPECYFLYFEELDWSMMFGRKGWKIMYDPSFTVYHKESATVGQQSALRSYYMTRNRQLFAQRNYTGMKRRLCILYSRFVASPKRILCAVAKGRKDIVQAIRRADRDFRIMMKDKQC